MKQALVAGLDLVVDVVLKDLDDEAQIEMAALDQVAVVVVELAEADEHPEALHDLGLNYDFGGVPVGLRPN